jgi:hypothetical protein
MTAPLELWQLAVVLIAICTALTGPLVWFFRTNTARLEKDNEKIITKLENSNEASFKGIKDDLKDFRSHFDTKISEVYVAVESKNRELKDFVSKELDYVKNHISTVEGKIYETRERGHEIEKDLLKLQSLISKDYITREDLYEFLRSKKIGAA